MKVGLVLPYALARPGGVRSHILGLKAALQRRGHQVDIIAPSLPDQGTLACGRARQLAFGGTQIDITWATAQELRKVAAMGFDVLHFHTIWNPFMALQLAAAARCPKVTTFHDVAGPDTPGWAKRLMPVASSAIRRWLVDETIAVSPAAASHLRGSDYFVVPNGLSAPPPGPAGERQGLLFLGRLEPRKGLEVLLRALALMADPPALKVAGEGPLRETMENLARELGLTQVSFLGEVSEDDKWRLLRSAQLLVVPSLGGESFGIVLVEAMACGTPPVAAANEGYRAVLRPQAGNLLAPPGDAWATARQISRMLADPQLYSEVQQWCLQEWPRYEWDELVKEVEAVYFKAVRGRTRQPSRGLPVG